MINKLIDEINVIKELFGIYNKLSKFKYFDDPTCKGYGAVNYWHEISASKQADIIAKHKVDVYHIEFFGWADSRISLKSVKSKYRKLLSECRKRNVVLFVSIFNDNSHISKYGNAPWVPDIKYLEEALDFIIEEGAKGVIVQPVGETQTTLGKNFEKLALTKLVNSGMRYCYNNGSRPTKAPAGWTYIAYHPLNMKTKTPTNVVNVTDTGPLLNELGGYERFDSNKVTEYGTTVLKTWGRPLVLYGFLHKNIDEASVKALGKI